MGYLNSSVDNKGKITLDRKTFKILASETRVGILKRLDKRQMTVSDLARTMNMNKATVFEHLEKLIDAGLIKKKEDERKWVYYSLT
jgi:DNA-binding transcriptional ArsR family regulator